MYNFLKVCILSTILSSNHLSINKAINEIQTNQMPKMITMSYYNDTSTEMAFNYNTNWQTDTVLQVSNTTDFSGDILEFVGTTTKSLIANDGFIHQVVATNLTPNTKYYYRLGDKELNYWSDIGSFKTANPEKKGATFVHISDPQGYEEVHYENYNELLNLAIQNCNPDFFALSGDIVNNSYIDATPKLEQWEWALTDQAEIMQNYPFLTTAGNHDEAPNDYNSRFNHPVPENGYSEGGSYYSVDYQGIHFVSVNTNDTIDNETSARGISDTQYAWLEEDLASASDAKFIIVMQHKGIYDAGGHCSNLEGEDYDIEKLREQLSPLYTKYNVDLVLQGHDHLYSRSYPLQGVNDNGFTTIANKETSKTTVTYENNEYDLYQNPQGTIYLNSGTASGSKYYSVVDYNQDDIPLEVTYSPSSRMYTEIKIEDDTLYAKTYKVTQGRLELFDTFGISKSLDNNSDDNNNNNEENNEDNNNISTPNKNENLTFILGGVGLVIVIAVVTTVVVLKKKNEKGDEE